MTRLNRSAPRAAPPLPWRCELVEIDTDAVPFMLSALYLKEQRYNWLSEDDARDGRRMLAKQGAQLLMGCIKEITNRQDALYALADRAINGTAYGVSGQGTDADPYVWSPPLSVAPLLQFDLPGLLKQAQTSGRQLDNLTNGTVYDEAPDNRNIRQQLDDLIVAAGGQQLDDEMYGKLIEIALLLA